MQIVQSILKRELWELKQHFQIPNTFYGPANMPAFVLPLMKNRMQSSFPKLPFKNYKEDTALLVIGADNKVKLRSVQAGERIGSLWIIDSGLNAGEKVVVEGLQKIREGVTVNPTVVEIQETSPSSAAPAESAT